MRSFFRYYKWHIFFLLLIAVCVGFVLANVTYKKTPDLSLVYVGKNYINVQTFNDNKNIIELLLHDSNDDGEKISLISAYAVDLESDLHEVFEKVIEKDTFDLIIADKTAFTKYEDKDVFVTATDYANISNKSFETLKDGSGRVYAVSLEDNDFVKRFGIVDSTDLYIAAINPKDGEELTTNRKNGRNIAGYILTQE